MTSNENKEFEFKVGDKVKIPESSQEHTLKDNNDDTYPFRIIYTDTKGYLRVSTYTLQGRIIQSHELPVLTLMERPKKYKEVTKEYIGNLYDSCFIDYPTIEQAIDKHDGSNILNPDHKIVKITYMVEDLDN